MILIYSYSFWFLNCHSEGPIGFYDEIMDMMNVERRLLEIGNIGEVWSENASILSITGK